ncbi:MAG: 4Fe-4S binding protein [Clostridiaceae bacterium]|jgi:aryl-alcohol dehydrogenase-like predicted oxidoreductase|nr:4Fe-4S binding protein [Clostridiaceae bacterium]
MEYTQLGKTGITVSRMCFGALIIGPLQVNLPVADGARVIRAALDRGVNFIDTAELYGTYDHIREASRGMDKKPVVATKCYAWNKEEAAKSVEDARKGLDIDVIDIFMMHEQESKLTLRGHREALEYYLNEREKGRIRAVGVSTHNVEVVRAICDMPEIDVVHPLVNKAGIGIGDGTIDDMLDAVQQAYEAGKGVYSMKPLGGGNLLHSYDECIDFVLNIPYIHSIAIGMQSVEEVEMNILRFEGKRIPEGLKKSASITQKQLHIDYWCEACGRCVERCKQGALSLVDGRVKVEKGKCVLCGYCGSVCPQFAIKIC